MEVATDKGYEIVARKLMHNMLYDNGAVNMYEPDGYKRYPKVIFDKITIACEVFFTAHLELLTDEDLNNIANGIEEENAELYGMYPEYKELSNLLNEYFELM